MMKLVEMSKADWLLRDLKHDAEARRENLVDAMRALADRLMKAAGTLAGGRMCNSLGEVQGLGAEIDRRCGELALAEKVLQAATQALAEERR